MWARVLEFVIATWLPLSPWFFRAEDKFSLVIVESIVGLVIALLTALSYLPRWRYLHFGNVLVALMLVGWGRLAESFPPPVHQGHIVMGLVLLMIALIPVDASQPPPGWKSGESKR